MSKVPAGTCPYCGGYDVYGGHNLDKDIGSSDTETIHMECQDCNKDFFVNYKYTGADKNE